MGERERKRMSDNRPGVFEMVRPGDRGALPALLSGRSSPAVAFDEQLAGTEVDG